MTKIIDGKKYEIEIEFSSNEISLFDLILDEIEKENIGKEEHVDD